MSAVRKINEDGAQKSAKAYEWKKRILVVDDEPDIANSYKDILCPVDVNNVTKIRSSRSAPAAVKAMPSEKDEFEIVVVNTAQAAIEAVIESVSKGQFFALGFFDVMLGEGIDGIELVKEIQVLDPNMYAVFVTAYNDRSVDSIRTMLGEQRTAMWDYLNKPFSSGEILQKARNYVTLWNLKSEKEINEKQMANVQRKLLDAERVNSVAAISRGVTHEFGNILMQIMGKADISRNKEQPEMKRALEIILDASQRAAKILDRFKNLSSSGNQKQEKEQAYLDDILERAIELMEFQFKDHNVKTSRIKIIKVSVPVNVTSILQVILNLIINAVHAMGDSGQLDLEVSKSNEYGQIRIRDYGPGIKPDLLDKVKEPFFTTKGKQGSGLGLSICNEIVQIEHGGELIVKNHGVKGLEVLVRLPLIDPLEDQSE